jgi:FkbM family methyltransferase
MRFLRTLNPKLVALDIGANIGIHSVVLSSEVGEGRVYSFEAQRVVFNMLVGNIALNSLENVFCYHNAVSNQNELIDIPTFDYGKPMSFGSVEFGGAQNESIGQSPFFGACEKVPTIVLDEVNFQQVNFMKIDVEGMEIKVLLGAKNLIDKFKPIILVEYLKSDKDELIYFLKNIDYKIYIGLGANYLCVPINLKFSLNSLQEVT